MQSGHFQYVRSFKEKTVQYVWPIKHKLDIKQIVTGYEAVGMTDCSLSVAVLGGTH